ncbi:MAG: hypothetical protein ACMG6S_26170 [Byssovorax sp.]
MIAVLVRWLMAIGAAVALDPAGGARANACSADTDCGYEPSSDVCDSDPRSNRQPPLRDQGVLCYCDDSARRCAMLRVPPVPCEGDFSCAVSLAPRPHPVAADAAHPHQKGRACRDFKISTTCERTNICTMNVHECPDGTARR